MINQYKDLRGFRIADEDMRESLDFFGKTESEVIDFIGKDNAKINGYFHSFLQNWTPMHKWLTERDKCELPDINLDGFKRFK